MATPEPLLGLGPMMQRPVGLVRWGSSRPPLSAPARPFLGNALAGEEFATELLQLAGDVITLDSTSAGKIYGVHSRSSLERAQEQFEVCPASCIGRGGRTGAGLVPQGGAHGHGREQPARAVPAAPFLACSPQPFARSSK